MNRAEPSAIEFDDARFGCDIPGEYAEQRELSGTVRSDERMDLSVVQRD